MHNNDRRIVQKIISEIELIQDFVEGYSFERFMSDEKTRRSVVMTFINIAESAKLLSENFQTLNATIPVKELRALRNVAAHTYDGIRFELVWIAIEKLPKLKTNLLTIN